MSQFSHSRQFIVLQTRDYPVYNFWPVEPVRAGHRGISPQKRRNFGLGELTPQQRQIVRLASDGLTDREIGDRLFLSPRTVSSHLYRSYPKLGVASRHQLRDVIAPAGAPATAHESAAREIRL